MQNLLLQKTFGVLDSDTTDHSCLGCQDLGLHSAAQAPPCEEFGGDVAVVARFGGTVCFDFSRLALLIYSFSGIDFF